jgi:hypothetical protein
MTDHPATVELQRPGIHAATCPCGWMGADYSDESKADGEAKLHREGKRQSWTLGEAPAEMRPLGEWPFKGT